MAKLFQRLKEWFGKKEPEPAHLLEELRQTFRAKYHAFRLLLQANNTALQLMAEMEATLHGSRASA